MVILDAATPREAIPAPLGSATRCQEVFSVVVGKSKDQLSSVLLSKTNKERHGCCLSRLGT